MKSIDAKHFLIDVSLVTTGQEDSDAYPYSLPAIRALRKKLVFHPQVTFLVGENGSGKSTLVEALAVAVGLNPEGGSRHFHFATRESHSGLHERLRVARGLKRPRDSYFLRAESYFNVASEIERLGPGVAAAYGARKLHEQSHGESFLALFQHRFRGGGLYLLDEPEAALSPSRQLSFLALLDGLVDRGSQFVIATHSPIILGYPRAELFLLTSAGVEKVAYQETEHYQLTRDFLNRPEAYFARLLPSRKKTTEET